MSNNPKLQDMGEHGKQLLDFIHECKLDADLEFLASKLKKWKIGFHQIPTKYGFIIHDDKTVTDVQTGLMWKRECEPNKYTYDEAIERFKGNDSFAGYNDWRLPTIDELKTLLLKNPPYIDTEAFPNNPPDVLSGSLDVGSSSYAWYVFFPIDYVGYLNRTKSYYVRLVR